MVDRESSPIFTRVARSTNLPSGWITVLPCFTSATRTSMTAGTPPLPQSRVPAPPPQGCASCTPPGSLPLLVSRGMSTPDGAAGAGETLNPGG